MIFALGQFNFINASRVDDPAGPPEFPREQVEVIQRPGINGTGLLLLGSKGTPFQLRTMAGVTSRNDGLELIANYHAQIGLDPLEMVWADEYLSAENGVVYQVLNVTDTSVKVLGVSTSYGVVVWATFTLLPIAL